MFNMSKLNQVLDEEGLKEMGQQQHSKPFQSLENKTITAEGGLKGRQKSTKKDAKCISTSDSKTTKMSSIKDKIQKEEPVSSKLSKAKKITKKTDTSAKDGKNEDLTENESTVESGEIKVTGPGHQHEEETVTPEPTIDERRTEQATVPKSSTGPKTAEREETEITEISTGVGKIKSKTGSNLKTATQKDEGNEAELPRPTTGARKGKGTAGPKSKTATQKNEGNEAEPPKPTTGLRKGKSTAGPKSKTDAKDTIDEKQQKVLTDYFPVRRSTRMPSSVLKKQEDDRLQKAVLSGKIDGIKVVEIEGKGRGVVATKPFKRGDFVVEYAGQLISLKEAKRREDKYKKNPDIGCYMYYFNFQNRSYCIDATAESDKLGRLLNHSKNGNCTTKVIGIGDTPYLLLMADKEIAVGDELLYDYGDRNKESLESHPWLAL